MPAISRLNGLRRMPWEVLQALASLASSVRARRDAMRVIGAVAGVAVAESLQQPKPQQTYTFSMSPSQGFSFQQNNPGHESWHEQPRRIIQTGAYAGLGSGTEQMAPDKRDKLAIQERNALQARDTYARSLYTLQQAEENQALRDQAEHFEHLYLDIIHSTAGNWPGRSAPPSRSCPGARTA